MAINVNDYIQGYEYYGRDDNIQIIRGWVGSIDNDGEHFTYYIQADDRWRGHRGTYVFSRLGKVTKLENRERPKL